MSSNIVSFEDTFSVREGVQIDLVQFCFTVSF
jgi:hypothetical protein